MIHSTFTQSTKVSDHQTAAYLGSGTLEVFGTPALVAFMENTAMKMLSDLPTESTSVGISMNMQHLKASPVGATVECTATITAIEGRKYSFAIKAIDASGDLIGEAMHERVIVNIDKFMSKVLS
ncbi:Thioesterase superfamily [Paludibacter propionicigenes WB4]|uniref:Thioesterase superfamily n=1 Tax=Paludibacter propionicigenes (strain DSM 17365 / JCM 13257 / WB4) TaxID=694427 RepID=E4T2L8_PALPW|nr:thioesterase family protein [Paludibacter propionicigenes]ADQ78962.1 Thioesterase superfamily [Paludibacter propionicigenes WB4]